MTRRLSGLVVAALLVGACSGPQSLLSSRPMQFSCPQLAEYVVAYDHRSFADIQKYALQTPANRDPDDSADFPLQDQQLVAGMASDRSDRIRMLLLSGGGQWGAFGAGFLNAQPLANRNFDVVTGVSTGAIQALFVGADQYERMEELYRLPDTNPARSNGMIGLAVKGSQYDLAPLREMLVRELYGRGDGENGGKESLLDAIARERGAREIRIAMVEGRSSDLKIVRLSEYVREHYPRKDHPSAYSRKEIGDCVAGLVLASSAIPLRLTPVQIDIGDASGLQGDYRTLMDGGVRLSIIDRQFGQLAENIHAAGLCQSLGPEKECTRENLRDGFEEGSLSDQPAPLVYVVRNGPTIVPDNSLDAHIDKDPDAYVTAMRGYSILVNQNELASIAEMQARYPYESLRVVSADGYNWMTGEAVPGDATRSICADRDEDVYFDKDFMICLADFGHWRAANIDAQTGGWQLLQPLAGSEKGLVADTVLPSDAILRRAAQALQARR